MANKKKLLKGLKNIHFAAFINGAFTTPVRVDNAKAIESGLNFESEGTWADDVLVDAEYTFAGGEGKVTVLGLTKEEYNTLFAAKIVKGGVIVKTTDISPQGAFLFERGKKGSKHRRLYVVYACSCSPNSISAEGIEEGKGEAGVDEIEYAISSLEDGSIYHFIDTDDATVDQAAVEGWYTEVQMPKDLPTPQVTVDNNIKVGENLTVGQSMQKQFEESFEK